MCSANGGAAAPRDTQARQADVAAPLAAAPRAKLLLRFKACFKAADGVITLAAVSLLARRRFVIKACVVRAADVAVGAVVRGAVGRHAQRGSEARRRAARQRVVRQHARGVHRVADHAAERRRHIFRVVAVLWARQAILVTCTAAGHQLGGGGHRAARLLRRL